MKPWYSLEEKTIWVIGGAGYLGSAITKALDGLCARTLCLDLNGKASDLVRTQELKNTVPLSLEAHSSSKRIEQLLHEYGAPDGVVYLAFASSAGKKLEELSGEEFSRTFEHSLTPAFEACRKLAESMKPRRAGSIVLFSSMYGMVSPDPQTYGEELAPNPIDYGASKAAIQQMTRYFAVHYGRAGIRFNSLVPGPFPNPGVQASHPEFLKNLRAKAPLGRVGESEEIVGPTLFLLTDGASYMTGHSLVVDGGWMAW